ncbi:MAG TPA: ATP-binding protein [Telluria sp.]|nr:ATP-binding protein [Telluria sp.]
MKGRSLFLRFFLASAATLFVVWFGVLLWEAYVVQARFEQVQAAETKGWTRQIVASVGNRRLSAEDVRATVQRIEAARNRLFTETGFFKPRWRLQVWRDGSLVYGSEAALPNADSHWSVWTERDPASGVTVRLAQEFVIAWTFALAGSSHQFAPLLYCFPFLLLTSWLTIRYGMQPLNAIVAQIRRRSAADLSPLPVPVHRELAPLVHSTNELMDRLGHRLRREQEFLGDAAHQLKTPLAIVQSNAELLVDAREPALAAAARDGLREGVADAVHVVHQLLALVRSEAQGDADPLETLDLAEVVRKRLALAVGMALPRRIDLAFDAPECCPARVRRAGVTALIDNLVSNAIKYSPDGGRIDVGLTLTDEDILLSVADEGPGIAPSLRGKVFERFYRAPDQEQGGSGLGLAIVERAAANNMASVRLRDGPRGRGLMVQVLFQASLVCDTSMPSASA